jgi:pilus assembly protein CpaF
MDVERERRRAWRQRLERQVDRWDEWRSAPREEVAERMRAWVAEKVAPLGLAEDDAATLVEGVLDGVLGLGPLEPLLRDPRVRGIRVERPERVTVVVDGTERDTPLDFDDEDHLDRVIEDLKYGARQDGSLARDGWFGWRGRLVDGSRFVAWQPPFFLGGPQLRIDRDPTG